MTASPFPIGMLPDGWGVSTLGEITTKIGSGATPRGGAKVYTDSGVSLIRSQNVYDHHFTKAGLVHIPDDAASKLASVEVHERDVLINITGDSILRCCVVDPSVLPARVNQHVAIVRTDGSLHPLLLQKYLTLPRMKKFMLGHSSGGTRKAITKGHIESFPVPLPPRTTQDAMVAFFAAVDSRLAASVRLRRGVRRLCETMSLKIGEEVPWVPLREITRNAKESVAPASIEASVVDHFSLPAFDKGERPERSAPASIRSNKLHIDEESVLLSRLNPRIPRMWWAEPDPHVQAICSTEFMVLRPLAGASLADLWLACAAPQFWSEMRRRATGTSGSHQRVRPDDVLEIEVPDTRAASDDVRGIADAALRLVAQAARESWVLEGLLEEITPALFRGEAALTQGDTS